MHIFFTELPCQLNIYSPFLDNCWVGVSVTANGDMTNAYYRLANLKVGKRFISFEPLHDSVGMNDHVNIKSWLDRVIIGAQTPYSPKTAPRLEWIEEIVLAADKVRIPVFLKNNLELIIPNQHWILRNISDGKLRQEFPR